MKAMLIVVALVVAGCSQDNSGPTPSPIGAASGPWNTLDKIATESLGDRIAKLDGRVNDLELAKAMRDLEDSNMAMFDPQDPKTYTALKAPAGTILVVLDKVEPYLDGFVVSFRLGNPGSASYAGVKGKISWGHAYDKTKDTAYNAVQSREFNDTTVLEPGAWTIIKINVAPATAAQVRRLVIEPNFNEIRLRAPRGQ